MSCPVCNHTMQNLMTGSGNAQVFWCQRCGTLKEVRGDFEKVETTLLIKNVQSVYAKVARPDKRFLDVAFYMEDAQESVPFGLMILSPDGKRLI